MRELKKVSLEDVVFIDIETSSSVKELELDTPLFDSWEYKFKSDNLSNEELIEKYANESALYADFGRIVCVSVGRLWKGEFVMKTFNNLDEREMILELNDFLDKLGKDSLLCGHAIKQFDIPYIFQRSIINNVAPHNLMDVSGLKPWELNWIIDTKDLWQGSGFNRSSLINITTALGLPSPKDDISGADVPKLFWEDPAGNIERISRYCEKDVIAVYEVLKKFKNVGKEEKDSFNNAPVIQVLFEGGKYGENAKRELIMLMETLTPDERLKAYVVLESLVSTAKGKKTKFSKSDIKELKMIFND